MEGNPSQNGRCIEKLCCTDTESERKDVFKHSKQSNLQENWLSTDLPRKDASPSHPRRSSMSSTSAPHSCLSGFEKATRYWFDAKIEHWKSERVAVAIDSTPFARGSFRTCHKMRVCGQSGEEEQMVAKIFKQSKPSTEYFRTAMTQEMARGFADKFNKNAESSQKISFAAVHVLKLHERGDCLVCAEPMLEGKYCKHVSNTGDLKGADALAQAFCHFTWEASGRRVLICDIQGVGNVYTDPSLQCNEEETGEFGEARGNWGGRAVRSFFQQHRCSHHCRAHALAPAQRELSLLGCIHLPLPASYVEAGTGKRRVWRPKKDFDTALRRALPLCA